MPTPRLQSTWRGPRARRFFSALTACSLASGCAAQPTATAAITKVSSANLFAAVETLAPEKRQELTNAIGSLSLTQYYDLLLAHASSSATVVDAVNFTNSLAELKASQATFTLLGSRFHSVGSLWQHLGIEPATMSLNQFRAYLEGLEDATTATTASEEASFALLDWSVRPNLPDACQRRINRITDLFGFGANDIAGALTTWENNGFDDSTTHSALGSVTVSAEGDDGLHLQFTNPGGDAYTGTNRFVNDCFQDDVDGQDGGEPSGSSGSSLSTQIMMCAAIYYSSSVCSKLKGG